MRTVTETTDVYTYDELTEEQKEKVLERYADINVEVEWWDYDGLLGFSTAEMKARPHLDYSIELWQWADMYFGGVGYDRNKYIQFNGLWVADDNEFRKFLRIPKRLWVHCAWWFENDSSNWNTQSTRLIIEADFPDSRGDGINGWEFTGKQQAIIDRAIEIMNDKIDAAWTDLDKTYDYLTIRVAIEETLKCNSYEFTADGKIA